MYVTYTNTRQCFINAFMKSHVYRLGNSDWNALFKSCTTYYDSLEHKPAKYMLPASDIMVQLTYGLFVSYTLLPLVSDMYLTCLCSKQSINTR